MKSLQTVCLLFATAGLVAAQQYTIKTVAGVPQVPGLYPFNGDFTVTAATTGQLYQPSTVVTDSKGNFYISDFYTNTVRMVTLSSGNITTIAGNSPAGTVGGTAILSANLTDVHGLAVDTAGNVYISDTSSCRIQKVDISANITTYAGNTQVPYCGPNANAPFVSPGALALDSKGNLYVADYTASVVRVVSSTGAVSIFAGTGTYGYSGDGAAASKANLAYPVSLTFDGAGNLYIGDLGNRNIRKVDTSGNITTVVSGVSAQGLAIDSSGVFYYVDSVSSTVRKILPGGGVVTIAGNGIPGYAGDGGLTSQSLLNQPAAIAIAPDGSLLVADTFNAVIRRLVQVPSSLGVQDSASEVPGAALQTGVIAPGEILTLFGTGLGSSVAPVVASPKGGLYPTQSAGTSVTFNGTPAPIIYTSSGLVAVVAPYEITGSQTATIALTYQGSTVTATMPVSARVPNLFTANASGLGQAAAINDADGSVNSATNPAHLGSYVTVYLSGAGYTSNPVDGQVTPLTCAVTSSCPLPVLGVQVKIGSQFVTPSYAGAAPSLIAGLTQVNFQIPTNVIPGTNLVQVIVGNYYTQSGVTLNIAQ